MKRMYEHMLVGHFEENRQMVFLSGPRQVGKTTLARAALPRGVYFNYDNPIDGHIIRAGAEKIAETLDLSQPQNRANGVIFDEIHKQPRWKSLLKGFFDSYGAGLKILVTGSARLNVYKRGGDSLMGRYFHYRMHPLTLAEVAGRKPDLDSEFQAPIKVSAASLQKLMEFGGYPEPFLNGSKRFYNKWTNLRMEQIFNEDLRDLSRVQDIKGIRGLAELLGGCLGSGINYSSIAREMSITVDTVKAWIALLESVYYCYTVRPWFKNVANSIRKQPKVYLWDWSLAEDPGARCENFVASHLLKAVHWWTDSGLGVYELCYLRDKQQREVDFLVIKNKEPFMLVECKKSSHDLLSPSLAYYQKILKIPHAFQAVFDLPQSNINPLEYKTPIKLGVADLFKILY